MAYCVEHLVHAIAAETIEPIRPGRKYPKNFNKRNGRFLLWIPIQSVKLMTLGNHMILNDEPLEKTACEFDYKNILCFAKYAAKPVKIAC